MRYIDGLAAFLLAVTVTAGAAQAQTPKQKPEKDLPTLPKMSAPSNIAGSVTEVSAENILYLDLSTGGRVKIIMRPDVAPKHVERIRTLTREGFYNGLTFHRVIDGFMAQGGDPTGTGQGGSKYPDLEAEFNDLPHVRGAVAMARAKDVNSGNSQFYIVLQPVLKLDRTYTIWGRVVEGMQFVDAIEKGEPPENPSKIIRASIGADKVPPPAPSSPIPATSLTAPQVPPPSLTVSPPPPPKP